MKTKKETKVYECIHYEFDYDDFGKYHWCHNLNIPGHECNVGRGIYCQKFCPGYKKGNFRGSWVISDWEKQDAEQFKKELEEKTREEKIKERALYEHLKKKFEG